jgi:hypothetical protein
MKIHRLAPAFCVLLVPAAAHCEPEDEVAPPALAQSPSPSPPAPYPGDPATPASDTNGDPDGPATASGGAGPGEYAVGEDDDSYEDNDQAALTDFHPALDPYGAWTDDPTYGTVWVPSITAVGSDFRPYATSGHWVYDNDWVWASDYSWGWAPFHYGRWVLIEGRGWSWIPGRAYRGAWVDWSVDDGYGFLGWAPAPPVFVWFGGVPIGWNRGYIRPRWVYCPRGEVFSPAVGARLVAGPAAVSVAAHMRFYGTASARVAGPSPEHFGYTGAQVPQPTGEVQSHIARAQQFARPSTAQPLGARPPSQSPHEARSAGTPGRAPGANVPVRRSPAAPAPRGPSGGFGGHVRGGGGGHHR